MPDWFDTPLSAILAFEKLTRLHVSVHEMSGALWSFLPPERFLHMEGACVAAKSVALERCVKFDVVQTRSAMAVLPEGRVHVCHAGLVEWVVPTIKNGKLQRLFFAGQRRPGPKLTCFSGATDPVHTSWAHHVRALDPVDDEEAEWILESLRQLSARIELWRLNPPQDGLAEVIDADGPSKAKPGMLARHMLPRQQIIRYFIDERHTRNVTLADLAQRLHLSESRAGHAVRELCGMSFVQLLIEARLKTAAGLLRHTDLSVAQVAASSGFENASHFHQMFRRKFGTTPHRYRAGSDSTEPGSKPEPGS